MNLVEVLGDSRKVVDSYIETKEIPEIVEIGSKAVKKAKVRHKDEEHQVMYRIIERVNPYLAVGKRRTVQRGVRGRRVDHLEITGSERKVVSSDIILAPVDKIVEIGGMVTETAERSEQPAVRVRERQVDGPDASGEKIRHKTEEHQVAYRVIERVNPDLEIGKRRTVQHGVRGRRLDFLEIGARQRVILGFTLIQAPVDKIVEVGGRPPKTPNPVVTKPESI